MVGSLPIFEADSVRPGDGMDRGAENVLFGDQWRCRVRKGR